MIKYTSYVDLLERQPRENAACSHKPQEETISLHAQGVAHLEAQLLECFDGEARVALVEMLKAQIDAGSYHVDSTILAQKIQDILVGPAAEAEMHIALHSDVDE